MGLFKKSISIDPKDFLALRAELVDLRSRLEESEQARAVVEARLGALDASTTALAASPGSPGLVSPAVDLAGMNGRIETLESQIRTVAAQSAAGGPNSVELNAKIDALHSRVLNMAEITNRVQNLEEQVSSVNNRVADVADLAQRPAIAAATPLAPPTDPGLATRVDELAGKVSTIEALSAKFVVIDALASRVSTIDSLAHKVGAMDELSAKVGAIDDLHHRIAGLDSEIAHLTSAQAEAISRVEQLGAAAPAGPDADTLARLDAMAGELAHLQRLGGEVGAIREELAGVAAIRQQLDEVADTTNTLQASVAHAAAAEPTNPGPDPDTFARLDELARRLADVESISQQVAELNDRVNVVAATADQLAATPPPEAPTFDTSAIDSLRDQLGMLAERVTASDADARGTKELLAALDQRLTGIGTELANQMSELGRDIDGLAERAPAQQVAAGMVSDEVIAELKNSQVKLAAEQARYEIAFRQDLATLAEHLRRPAR
jgi:DNA repair exonuclease SbcCD ATPase subunit